MTAEEIEDALANMPLEKKAGLLKKLLSEYPDECAKHVKACMDTYGEGPVLEAIAKVLTSATGEA